MQLLACVLCAEVPMHRSVPTIALRLEGSHVALESLFIRDVAFPGLACEDAKLDLSHVEPTSVLWREMELKSLADPVGFFGFERLVEG